MTSDESPPARYRVIFSQRVRQRLLELADAARQRGDGLQFVAAVKEFERRLRVYPQFGDPLWDLQQHEGQIRLGIVPPLAMRYGVLEGSKQVLVVALPVLLANASNREND
jgi:hypothetical protein